MYSKDDSGDKPKIKLPSVEVAGGELKPAKLPLGAYGLRYTRKFAAGGKTERSKKEEIETARKMMMEGIEGEEDLLSKISTTMRKQARDRFKEGLKRYEKSDEKIREKEAYDFAGYKSGGKVSSASKRADGCAIRGKTKGRMV